MLGSSLKLDLLLILRSKKVERDEMCSREEVGRTLAEPWIMPLELEDFLALFGALHMNCKLQN